jgi:hypothetical protein
VDARLVLITAALFAVNALQTGAAHAKAVAEDPNPRDEVTDDAAQANPIEAAQISARHVWTHAGRLFHARLFSQIRGRRFDYVDALPPTLREFGSAATAAFGAAAEIYPLRFGENTGTTRRLGLEGLVAGDIGQSVRVFDFPNTEVSHQWLVWRLGLTFRTDFERLLLKFSAGAGVYRSAFGAGSDLDAVEELPSIENANVRLAVAARYEFPWFSTEAELAYFLILGGGHITTLFPNAAVGGIDMRFSLSRHLCWGLEVFIAFDYDHFYYDMRSRFGDEFLAGGALDLHFGGELGVSWAY